MLTPSDISKRLADRAADVARHLLPGGKREGAEWRAGDASGEKGKSLGVHLVGEKACGATSPPVSLATCWTSGGWRATATWRRR